MVDDNPIITAANYMAARTVPANHAKIYVDLPNTAAYFPIIYLPATLALAIGLVAKATPFTCFLMAKFFMLGTSCSLAVWLYGTRPLARRCC